MELDYFVGEHGVVVLRSHLLEQTLRQLRELPAEAARDAVRAHLKDLEDEEHKARLTVRDVDPAWTWFNTERPLSLHKDLRGKVVVLDFFTYCCANCLHILPDLERLEQTYSVADGLVVVGVHSAKFANERRDASIAEAVRRYHIQHAVVNDAELALWKALGVRSWPSLAVLGPHGNLVLMLAGEGHAATLDVVIREALTYYAEAGALSSSALPLAPNADGVHRAAATALSYPGKVAVDAAADRLYIADTGHHRLVIARLDGTVVATVGCAGERGAADGGYDDARFNAPNGLALADHPARLFVADTENHAIRVVDLEARTVTTLVGTGAQGSDYAGGQAGRHQALSSPWDLVYQPNAGAGRLLVAMAGIHQIWTVDVASGVAERYAGSGAEANRNSADAKVTAFAQPSGVALGRHGALYIADSESSAVRVIGVADKFYARAVCGGLKSDPSNLFAFGDADGRGDKARLQHPLAVLVVPGAVWNGGAAAAAADEDVLVVADTYNHRLKVVRHPIEQGETARWSGAASAGDSPVTDGPAETATFAEPSGLALDGPGRRLFVADTNHHAIRIVHIPDGHVETLTLHLPESADDEATDAAPARLADDRAKRYTFAALPSALQAGQRGVVELTLRLPPGFHITAWAPSRYQAVLPGGAGVRWIEPTAADLMDWATVENPDDAHIREATLRLPFEAAAAGSAAPAEAEADVALYYCNDTDGLCMSETAVLAFSPEPASGSHPAAAPVVWEYQVSM